MARLAFGQRLSRRLKRERPVKGDLQHSRINQAGEFVEFLSSASHVYVGRLYAPAHKACFIGDMESGSQSPAFSSVWAIRSKCSRSLTTSTMASMPSWCVAL